MWQRSEKYVALMSSPISISVNTAQVERRRRSRTLTSARSAFETVRLDRLHRLAQSIQTLQSLGNDKSQKELESLRRSAKEWKSPQTEQAGDESQVRDQLTALGARPWQAELTAPVLVEAIASGPV